MHKTSLLFFTTIVFVFGCSTAKPTSAQIGKLYPVDEAASNPSFFTFRARLLKAVNERDVAYLMSIVSANIRNTFGDNNGAAEFRKMWRLDRPNSEIWKELTAVLSLGGKFEGKQTFMAPYVYSNFPENFDAFEDWVIIGENVRVRREPNMRATVIKTLAFDVVKVTDSRPTKARGEKSGWIAVQLADGQPGFVNEVFIRSGVDYRAIFEKQGDKWIMTAFIAGD